MLHFFPQYTTSANADHIWFAFLSPEDEICRDLDIDDATQVRIVSYSDIPLFALFYKKELKTLDPYTVLSLLGSERIFFPTEQDKEGFAEDLMNKLAAYDSMTAKLSRASHIAMVAGGVIAGAAAAVVGAIAILKHARK